MVVQGWIGGWSERCGEAPAYPRDGVEQSEHDHLIAGIARTLESIQALDDRFSDRPRRIAAVTAQRPVDELEVRRIALLTEQVDRFGHGDGHQVRSSSTAWTRSSAHDLSPVSIMAWRPPATSLTTS